MHKTFLVAQREFMENMKTKTFWLGIFAAPIMLILFYGGMFLLANKTDVRKYVVLDHSQSDEFGVLRLALGRHRILDVVQAVRVTFGPVALFEISTMASVRARKELFWAS